jgi:predicted hotdog family 3-hydroxylacyl-ACP dehydratase
MNALPSPVECLPHRPPMLLVDEVLAIEEGACRTLARLDEGHPFFDAELGGVPAWIAVEIMAQSVGIYSGHFSALRGEPVRIGYLIGLRRASWDVPCFPRGSVVVTEVRELFRDDSGFGSFDAVMQLDGREVARTRLNAFQTELEIGED